MADDSKFLKDNLQGFGPAPTAEDVITDVTRGSSILRLSKVQPMARETLKPEDPMILIGTSLYRQFPRL